MAKKSFEELLEETKQELEDIIAVLNDLKSSIKSETDSLYEIEVEKLNKLKSFLETLQNYLNSFETNLENIQYQISETNEKISDLYQKNLRKVEENLSIIRKEISEVLSNIEKSAKKGVIKGLDDSLYKVEKKLNSLKQITYKIYEALEKQKESLEEIFTKYQWSWLGPFLFTNLLLGLGIIYIGLQNAGKEKTSETFIGLLKISFILFSIFIVWEIFKRYVSNLWISISLVSILFVESFLITFSTLKDKIQIVRKKEIVQVCNYPKPNQIIKNTQNNPCYIYKNQKPFTVYWYSPNEDTWYQANKVAVCTTSD